MSKKLAAMLKQKTETGFTSGLEGVPEVEEKPAEPVHEHKQYLPTTTSFSGANKCCICEKTVYKMEETIAVGRVWHSACFTCGGSNKDGCGRVLKRDGYVDHDCQPYCNSCYNKQFRTKGFGIGTSLNTDFGQSTSSENISVPAAAPVHEPTPAPTATVGTSNHYTPGGFQGVGAAAKLSATNSSSPAPPAPPAPTTPAHVPAPPAPVVAAAVAPPAPSTPEPVPAASSGPSTHYTPGGFQGVGAAAKLSTASPASATKPEPKYTPTNNVAVTSQTPKCTSCAKSVYKMEEIIAVGRVWHLTCFTCGGTKGEGCKKVLKRDSYVDHDNQPFCNACYAKLYKPKGFGYGNTLSTDYGPTADVTSGVSKLSTREASPPPAQSRSTGGFQGVGSVAAAASRSPTNSAAPAPPAPVVVVAASAPSAPERRPSTGFQGVAAVAANKPAPPAPQAPKPIVHEEVEEEAHTASAAPARRPSTGLANSNVAPFSEDTISKFKQPTIVGVQVPSRRASLNIGGSTQADKADNLHKEQGYIGDNDEVDESEW